MEELDLDDLIQGETAEEKLKNAKEIIQTLEKEAFKLRAELKRTEISMKKLQESSLSTSHNANNTSSAFLLPSEFKKNWEVLVLELILDLFQPFLSSQVDLVLLVQLLCKTIIKQVDLDIAKKVSEIQSILGAFSEPEKVKKYMTRLFQDNSLTAFPMHLQSIRQEFIEQLPKNLASKGKELTQGGDFESFSSAMHRLAIHMALNDPPLELKFLMKPEYVTITKADEYYYIDGFPVGTALGIIVLPAVIRNSHPYAGTKPAVLVLPDGYIEPVEKEDRAKPDQPSHKTAELVTEDSYPPLQRKEASKKECLLCKIKSPCAYCSKMTLLALAKRVPSSGQRFINRVQSNSFIENPGKEGRNMTNCLSRRLSEAAKKIDKKNFIKNKHIDKEACKVM